MSYVFVNKAEVKIDIIQAIDNYKNTNPQLSKQFLFLIREAKTFIASSTLSFEVKYKEVRTLLLKQFLYHIHYLIEENKKQIIILAIIHAYKNPNDYSNR